MSKLRYRCFHNGKFFGGHEVTNIGKSNDLGFKSWLSFLDDVKLKDTLEST